MNDYRKSFSCLQNWPVSAQYRIVSELHTDLLKSHIRHLTAKVFKFYKNCISEIRTFRHWLDAQNHAVFVKFTPKKFFWWADGSPFCDYIETHCARVFFKNVKRQDVSCGPICRRNSIDTAIPRRSIKAPFAVNCNFSAKVSNKQLENSVRMDLNTFLHL